MKELTFHEYARCALTLFRQSVFFLALLVIFKALFCTFY